MFQIFLRAAQRSTIGGNSSGDFGHPEKVHRSDTVCFSDGPLRWCDRSLEGTFDLGAWVGYSGLLL